MSKQENLIPEAAVEAAAKAAYEFRYSGYKSWDDLTPVEQFDAEAEMQFALLAAAPHMLAEFEKQRKYAALNSIRELGSDTEPFERTAK